ncbi:MAG: uracil-DNA glycosylase [Polaromonas sp.]|nr:uracil-DNA glycosylase [Polaromonas sp.]
MMVMDKRQRAMLKEMGVRVWQPLPEAAAPVMPAITATPSSPVNRPESAIYSGANNARIHSPVVPLVTQKQPVQATPAAPQAEITANAATWRVGSLQTLYAATAVETSARWLVLLEAPAGALQGNFNPLDGEAGKLLDNMLRAAKLHSAGAVMLAPLVRAGTGGELPGALTDLLASAKADVVLVMGRLAAQALLQSTEPLAKLRGQAHQVQGQSVIITIDPAYLLRNPQDKPKAWDDLCLGMSLVKSS